LRQQDEPAMKAVVFHEYGGPEVLRYEDVPIPEPGAGEVLIRVGACSLNRGPDAMVRSGSFGLQGISLPHVCGADPAGEIVQVGDGVTDVAVGQRVAVYPVLSCETWCERCPRLGENYCAKFRVIGVHTWGGQAEFVRVPARNVVPIADSVSYEAATTLGVSYITTWHGMVTKAQTTADDTVLVMAAGSGVGAAAIQIGAMLGARVLATTGADWKADRALKLGADQVFDYKDPAWPDKVMAATDGKGVDVLFDNVVSTWSQSLNVLARGGRVFCSGTTSATEATIDVRRLYRNMNTLYFHMQGTKSEMAHIAALMASGDLQPAIDSVYSLSEATAAQQRLDRNDQFGKIILRPDAA
jgi:acryloyl-coenzyme A reductase